MGTWGERLFEDDTAADVRDDWKEVFQASGSAKTATDKVMRALKHEIADPDEGPIVWLALAVTEHKHGYATPKVLKQARRILDKELGLDRWEEQGDRALRARLKEYSRIRSILDSPRPKPKKVEPKKPKLEDPGLLPGDIFRLPLPDADNEFAYFKVIAIKKDRTAIDPVVTLLDVPPPNATPPQNWRRLRALGLRDYDNPWGPNFRYTHATLWELKKKGSPRKQAQIVGEFGVTAAEQKLLAKRNGASVQWWNIAEMAKHSFDRSEWLSVSALKKRVMQMSMEELRRQSVAIRAEAAASRMGTWALSLTASDFLGERWDPRRALLLWDLAKQIDPDPDYDRARAQAIYALGRTKEAEKLWKDSLARAANPKQRSMYRSSIAKFKELAEERMKGS